MASRISTAVTTSRKLENTVTGLDIFVPDFTVEESKGSLEIFRTPKAFYHLVVVSKLYSEKNLQDEKKSEDNKEYATMHFTRNIEYTKFLKLRKDLDKKYSGTYVPEIENQQGLGTKIATTSKTISKVFRERQINLDKFMKWCASTPKIASSEILLNFIGLDNRNLKEITKNNDKTDAISSPVRDEKQESNDELFEELGYSTEEDILFKEENKESNSIKHFENDQIQKETNSSTIVAKPQARTTVGLFETNDLTGNVPVDDKELILLDDEDDNFNSLSISTKNVNLLKNIVSDDEDSSDLLDIQEDISSITSKIKTIKTRPTMLLAETKPSQKDSPVLTTNIDAGSIKDEDLMKYINENSDDVEDVDLGF